MIDDALYDAFGQRQVSTIFTQLNQYRVVLEVEPEFQHASRTTCSTIYLRRPPAAARCRSGDVHATSRTRSAPLAINHQGQFPVVTFSFNLAPRRVARRGGRRDRAGEGASSGMPASIQARFQGTRAGVPGVARERAAADPGRDRHRLHRARRALRELHPPDHDPLDAALGRRRRAARADALPARTSA